MSDLPRLLFCCFDVVPGPSASSRRLSEYVKGLSERFQVVVLSVKTPDHPHIEKYHGARLLRVPVGGGDITARAETFDRAVRRQLESEDYVLVHFFDPFGGYALAERRAELGYKLIYDACVFPSMELPFGTPDAPPHRRLLARSRRQELFCLMNSDAIIVGSPLTRDWVSTLGVEKEQVHVLRAPVDLSPYTPQAVGRPDGRPLRLVHLGSLSGTHGLLTLLEGLALAHARSPGRVLLSLVGPAAPGWRTRLEQEAGRLGVLGQIVFEPPVAHDELPSVLARADAGALSLEDTERNRVMGTPLSRLGEYLAAGRPVLAADLPAARQLVPPDAAVWYRPADPASLAEALLSLADDLPRRLERGAAARVAAVRWDAAKIRADLVALYSVVTGQPARRAIDEDGEVFDPNDITQLGGRLAEAQELTQLGPRPPSSSASGAIAPPGGDGTSRVDTDPTIGPPGAHPDALAGTTTARTLPLVTPAAPLPSPPESPAEVGLPGPRESSPLLQWAIEEPALAPAPAPPPAPGSDPAPALPARPAALPPPLPPPRPSRPGPPPIPKTSQSGVSLAGPPRAPPPALVSTPTPPPLPRGALSSTTPLPRSAPINLAASATSKAAFTGPIGTPPSTPSSPAVGAPPSTPVSAVSLPLPTRAPASPPMVARPSTPPSSPAISTPPSTPVSSVSVPVPIRAPASPPMVPLTSTPLSTSAVAPASPVAGTVISTSAKAPVTTPASPPINASASIPVSTSVTSASLASAPGVTTVGASESTPISPASIALEAPVAPPARAPAVAPAKAPTTPAVSPVSPALETAPFRAFSPAVATPQAPTPTLGLAPIPLPAISPPTRSRPLSPLPTVTPATPLFIAGPSTVHAPIEVHAEEPVQVSDEEVRSVDSPDPAVSAPAESEPNQSAPNRSTPDNSTPDESESDESELLAIDEVHAVDTDASPPESAIDPWLAQLVHGYCPPGSHLFDRPVPPTTMPGRDP